MKIVLPLLRELNFEVFRYVFGRCFTGLFCNRVWNSFFLVFFAILGSIGDAIGTTLGAFGGTFGIPIWRSVFDAKIVHFGVSPPTRENAALTPGGLARGW